MSKSNPVHNLFKVPDSAIVKNQAVEIGMLKSEIEELKHEVNELHTNLNKLKNLKKNSTKIQYVTSLINKLERARVHYLKVEKEREFFKNELQKFKTDIEMNEIFNQLTK